jgi:hypothetical protein
MTKEDLKSFKISDQAKKPTEKAGKKEEPPAASSVGFPHIEALVEASTPDLSGFEGRLAQLHEMTKSGSNKDKLAAKKAAAAYEKARALLQYLLDTKARLTASSSG